MMTRRSDCAAWPGGGLPTLTGTLLCCRVVAQDDARGSELAAFALPRLSLTEEECDHIDNTLIKPMIANGSLPDYLSLGQPLSAGSDLANAFSSESGTPSAMMFLPGDRVSSPQQYSQGDNGGGGGSSSGATVPAKGWSVGSGLGLSAPTVAVGSSSGGGASGGGQSALQSAASASSAGAAGQCVICTISPAVCFFNKTRCVSRRVVQRWTLEYWLRPGGGGPPLSCCRVLFAFLAALGTAS